MKKLIVMMLLAVMMVGCQQSISQDKQKEETAFVKAAKQRLVDNLEKYIKKGTKAENMEVVYSNDEDSICVINCRCVITKASGRIVSGQLQYVFYGASSLAQKDMFINLEEEKSIIDEAKDFIDKVEDDVNPDGRDTIGGWEDCMKYVIPIKMIGQSVERLKKEYPY